ncbi:MAG: outer membrane protein assembly factor BamE [Gammaproteobacteria bacterium]|nr:outer membrane protein assembly factor BamE [Gammaproteobacteria bacterium]
MFKTVFSVLLSVALLSGCSAPHLRLPKVGDLPFVHKIDVQQGNVITQEMVAQLRKGMDKKKVQFVMGSPIIKDTFNDKRWDYVYTFQHRGGTVEKRRITLVFADDKLDRVEGNVKAAEGEIEVDLHQDTTVDVPKNRGRGVMARIKETIPFTGDKDEKSDGKDKSKDKDAAADKTAKASDKPAAGDKLAATDKSARVAVPEDPDAEKALPAPIENPYENIQAAPGEGVVVPPDAPRYRQTKRGLGSRVLGVFGLGDSDYVRPTAPEKPQEPLVKRPEPEDE